MLRDVEEEQAPDVSGDLRAIGAHPDHWYPVAWAREVKLGKTFATSVAGEPIVLVRTTKGPVFALEVRSAHRQLPLSKGVLLTHHSPPS